MGIAYGNHAHSNLAYATSFAAGGGMAIDRWISYAVKVLRDAGVETYESCQGGAGHPYPEPIVRFYGTEADGWRALHAALTFGLPAWELRRFWSITKNEPRGPHWEMTFFPTSRLKKAQRDAEKSGLIR
jgi:hypothetical protein